MAHLAQTLLGSFQLTRNGRPTAGIRASKVRALLIYLTLEPTTPHPRTTLANLLWPNHSEKKARQNLRQTVRRLREAIGDTLLHLTDDTLHLNPHQTYWVDVWQWTSLLTAVRTHCPSAPLCPTCLAHLEQAADLYHGELLPGFALDECPEFESWLRHWRERFHQQALTLLHTLAEEHSRQQTWELATEYAQRQLALEPWREEAHRQLIHILASTGQRAAALEQYHRCCALLDEELGLLPSAETEQLRRRIETPPPPPQPLLAPPELLGRAAELSQLRQLLAQPTCTVLAILGPAGVGKSAVARTLLAHPPHGRYPLLLQGHPLTTATDFWAALGHILGVPHHAPAVTQALNQRPWLLLLDGFDHLPDLPHLLTHLTHHAPACQLLITSRYRPLWDGAHLFRLHGLPPAQQGEPLANNSGVQLFERVANRVRPSAPLREANLPIVADICRLVGGNPAAIELAAQWVRALRPAEILAELPQHGREFLAPLTASFAQSWARLTPSQQAAWADLAQLGESFTRPAALAVGALPPSTWAALWDAALLTQRPDGRYQLPAIYRLLAPAQPAPAATHQRIATFFADLVAGQTAGLRGGGQTAALHTLAQEWPHIGHAWRWSIAHTSADHMGRMAAGLFLYHELTGQTAAGAAWFAQAQPLWPHLPPPLVGELACYQGWLAFGAGATAEGLAWLEQGLALLGQHHAPQEPALAAYGAAVSHALGQQEVGWGLMRHSLAATHARGDWWGVALASRLAGQMATAEGDWANGRAHAQRALATARMVGDQWGATRCLHILGEVAYTVGDWAEAHRCLGEAHTLHEALADERQVAEMWHKRGLVATAEQDWGYATTCFEMSRQLWQGLGVASKEVGAWVQLGRVAQAQGASEAAQNLFHHALRVAVAHQLRHETANVLQEAIHLWQALAQAQRPWPALPHTHQPGDYVVHLLLRHAQEAAGAGRPLAANAGVLVDVMRGWA